MNQTPVEVLDTILGYLGFVVEIQEQERDGHTVLQILTHEPERLIGRQDAVIDDLQYLVNRVLGAQNPPGPRVIVDVEHHRAMRDDALIEKVLHLAQAVRSTGRSIQTDPLNSYDRRIVHNAFKDDPEVATWSPQDDSRVKRITLRVRRKD
ncbi:MAG: protein jag, partial [Terrimicrobiaceae bacterium]